MTPSQVRRGHCTRTGIRILIDFPANYIKPDGWANEPPAGTSIITDATA